MIRIEALLEGRLRTDFTIKEGELLNLNDHLRKTYLAVLKLGQASAQQVACVTGRSRANESMNLNCLVVIGKIQKRHDMRSMIFYKDNFVDDLDKKNIYALNIAKGENP